MSTRNIRNQPFCWQEKKINRFLRDNFEGMERAKMILLYQTITEIESDFNSKEIKYYTKVISSYSGLSKEFIPKAVKKFEKLGIIKVLNQKNEQTGKFDKKRIIFTPENIINTERKKIPPKTVHGKPLNGEGVNGHPRNYIEDSIYLENSNKKNIPVFADAKSPLSDPLLVATKENNSDGLSEKLLNKDVQKILDILYTANNTIPEPAFFGRKVFRDAINQLIEKVGSENAINAAKLAILVRNKKFAPSATTPLELRDKYHKLEEYLNKEKDNIGEMMGIEPSLDIPEGVNPFSNTADNGDFDYNAWAASQNKKGGKIFFGTDFSKK